MREKPNPPRWFYNVEERTRDCYLEGGNGRMYAEPAMTLAPEDGQWYCRECYYFRWNKQHRDDAEPPRIQDDLDEPRG